MIKHPKIVQLLAYSLKNHYLGETNAVYRYYIFKKYELFFKIVYGWGGDGETELYYILYVDFTR